MTHELSIGQAALREAQLERGFQGSTEERMTQRELEHLRQSMLDAELDQQPNQALVAPVNPLPFSDQQIHNAILAGADLPPLEVPDRSEPTQLLRRVDGRNPQHL